MSCTLSVMASKDWHHLAQQVRARRDELGLTQEALAASGGPSTATLRLIEGASAKSYRAKTLTQLEAGLQWQPGSVRRVLAGHDPLPADDGLPAPEPEDDYAARLDAFADWLESQPDEIQERALGVIFRRTRREAS